MRFLFVHQNFPAQYVHVARHLASLGHDVTFVTQNRRDTLAGIRKVVYAPSSGGTRCHPFAKQFDACVRNGEAVAGLCDRLERKRYRPDLVIGHNGWGELLYVKDVFKGVPLLGYFEFFYRFEDSDVSFDPEFPPDERDAMRVRTLNAVNLLGLEAVDHGQAPTLWQRSLYPPLYQTKISVAHEGIDTRQVRPDPTAKVWLGNGRCLSPDDEVVTYSARNLEPYRGFHVFMRALPELMRRRPHLDVVIIGGDGVSYGRRHPSGLTYREVLLKELTGQIDLARVHFVGRLPFALYLAVLQVSTAHVYMTYPFVLSWSLLEAMAAGCVVVCSRTAPTEEVVEDGLNGLFFDFFDTRRFIDTLEEVLTNRRAYETLRRAARDTIVQNYDLNTVCLPAQLELMKDVMAA